MEAKLKRTKRVITQAIDHEAKRLYGKKYEDLDEGNNEFGRTKMVSKKPNTLWEDFGTFFPIHVCIIMGFGAIIGGSSIPDLTNNARIIIVILGIISIIGGIRKIWRIE